MEKLTIKEYLKNYEYNYINIYKYNKFEVEGFKNNNTWIFKKLDGKELSTLAIELLYKKHVVAEYPENIVQVI